METKENRRTKLTKTMLKNSLVELMQKMPISKITIKGICENADVNRSTFYVYYSDQYALLNEIEDEIILNTKECIYKFDSGMNEVELLQTFLTYIWENNNLFRTLLCKQDDYSLQRRLINIALDQFRKKGKIENTWDDDTSEYVFNFIVAGSLSLIEGWINNSMGRTPRELAEIIILLTNRVASAYE